MTRLGMGWMGALVAIAVGGCSDDGVPATGSEATASDATGGSTITDADTGGTVSTTATTASSTITGVDESTGGSEATSATASGTSGSDASSSGESGGMPSTCMTDEDCVLVEDCCTCDALAVGQVPPMCPIVECEESVCSAGGLPDPVAHCELGFCELGGAECNPNMVACATPPPDCDDGSVPSVARGCWTGDCVPVEACASVGSCDDCPADQACIELLAKGPAGFLCSPIPEACAGTPSCACMAEACEDPFSACIDTDTGIRCECAAC